MTDARDAPPDAALAGLVASFWDWRRVQAPRTRDDIPRLDRPAGWRPAWSPQDVELHRLQLAELEGRLARLELPGNGGPDDIDARLLGSALARVRFELDVVASWQHDPSFYLDQTLGTVFDLLLPPPPFAQHRCAEIVVRLESFRATLVAARENLAGRVADELARTALAVSGGAGGNLVDAIRALMPLLDRSSATAISDAASGAARELDGYHRWLEAESRRSTPAVAVGRRAFCHYLYDVALLPFTPEEILAAAHQEWDRAVAFELFELHRSPAATWPDLPRSAEEQSEREQEAELEVRAFYESHDLLSQPASLRHYLNRPRPDYLAPLRWLGVADDLTGPDRLAEDGLSYVPPPGPELSYFYRANAADPRAGIVHEGAHYQQLALGWTHERLARRFFYDSCPNEGIAFYNEEMLLQAGLFDDAPITRRIVYNFMRLRALRVEVDVRLALGELSVAGAASILAARVPLERATAEEEAAFFVGSPGQGLSYTVGKLQLLRLLADARLAATGELDVRAFHDWLWRNGNVPFSLLRLALLGDRSDLERLDELRLVELGAGEREGGGAR